MSQPLRFTRCPGSEVRLSFDRLSAMVHTTAEGSQALIFAVTDRPINENEIFEVEAIGPINSRGCFEVDVIGHLPTANLPLSPVAGVVAELSASPAFALQVWAATPCCGCACKVWATHACVLLLLEDRRLCSLANCLVKL